VEGAIAAHQTALALEPKSVPAHNNLGSVYLAKGDAAAALGTFRAALAIDPMFAPTHINVGAALRNEGDLEGAIGSFLTAIALDPNNAAAYEHLAFVQTLRGDFTSAIRSYRTALDLNPSAAAVYLSLGKALVEKGQLAEAIALLKDAVGVKDGLGKVNSKDKLYTRLQLQSIEYQRWKGGKDGPEGREEGLESQLESILSGEKRTNGADEDLAYGRMCLQFKHRYVDAGNFFAVAFHGRPELANDLRTGNRFDAACAAALAGTVKGEGSAPLEETDRRIWREQARSWLEEDLALWTKLATSDRAADRVRTRAVLQHWKLERSLAGVRGKEALSKLPDSERPLWQKLWDDVDGVVSLSNQKK
jgi:tetratricopeptide (TPR) repeat protein